MVDGSVLDTWEREFGVLDGETHWDPVLSNSTLPQIPRDAPLAGLRVVSNPVFSFVGVREAWNRLKASPPIVGLLVFPTQLPSGVSVQYDMLVEEIKSCAEVRSLGRMGFVFRCTNPACGHIHRWKYYPNTHGCQLAVYTPTRAGPV